MTITTPEELDALEPGDVVMDADGDWMVKGFTDEMHQLQWGEEASECHLPALVVDPSLTGRVMALADWHETKADKARQFPGGAVDVMEKAAQVHDDAARRLREALAGPS